MATPRGGPAIVSPRHVAWPEEGDTNPAMIRSRVDLPEPKLPSTANAGVGMVLSHVSSNSISGLIEALAGEPYNGHADLPVLAGHLQLEVDEIFPLAEAFAEGIERPPQQPVEQSDENAHHGDAEHDAREIAALGRSRNIGSEPRGGEMSVAPARDLGDDRRGAGPQLLLDDVAIDALPGPGQTGVQLGLGRVGRRRGREPEPAEFAVAVAGLVIVASLVGHVRIISPRRSALPRRYVALLLLAPHRVSERRGM